MINFPYLVHFVEDRPINLVAHFEKNELIYMEERLKEIMTKMGIQIPPGERSHYEMKTVVQLTKENNDLFERAFRDIYYKYQMPKNEYKWMANYIGG